MDDSRQFVILAVQLLALAAVVTVAAWPLACGGRRRRLDLLATAVSVTLLIGWVTWEPDSRPSVLEAAELTEGVSSQRRKVFKDHLLPPRVTGDESMTVGVDHRNVWAYCPQSRSNLSSPGLPGISRLSVKFTIR